MIIRRLPTNIMRGVIYFLFTTATVAVALGVFVMQRQATKIGEYIAVSGVILLMLGIMMMSKEYRERGFHSTETISPQDTIHTFDDPPPSYMEVWRDSYLKDQKEKADSDPPPPPYRESWSKGLWKKYIQSERDQLCQLNASTLLRDTENATSSFRSHTWPPLRSALQGNETSLQITTPVITPVVAPPAAGDFSHHSSTSFDDTNTDLDRLRPTQLSSLCESSNSQPSLISSIGRENDDLRLITPSQLVYLYENRR